MGLLWGEGTATLPGLLMCAPSTLRRGWLLVDSFATRVLTLFPLADSQLLIIHIAAHDREWIAHC